ncbi:coiled-coil domain-containing protein 148-like isoform X1 [Xiphias gladius]|uniref:coiled-coil domain-containing protein 148-like isoform X1 n=1 Tax=Xiphias gladius TaxID=8245 RepID=UPI001A990CDA|nr:coiled-coil domain-containing protein 148-like isoform X1 [Xiphias gladius]XP_040004119.1 coiled-coil domain-containing protein 148-like isoform X1 [Xiphias gladius]
MSGRDLHTFITLCRAEHGEKLTLRMKNGLGSSKYKPSDYKRLQTIVDAKRLESDLIGQKIQKTHCAAKATKESSILRQHRQVWSRECPRLQKAEEKAENDIHDFLEQMRPNGRADTAIFSLQDYELFLQREREAFRIATVAPVHQLRDDLCFRLGEIQHQQFPAHPSNCEQVLQQIQFVKDQQDDITSKLHAEYLALEEEIMGLGLAKYLNTTSDNLVNIKNIPEEVLNSDCPYPELKDSLIQAFHFLSERYQSRLQGLQEQLQKTDRFCGWYPDDHVRYQFTLSQYTHDIPNHRALCMDKLRRLFPKKTRQELVEHGHVSDWQRFTQAQLTVVTEQWQRDKEGLLARALVTLQEATHAHQEELELHRDRQNQQDICSHLREKVQQWRAQQEEVVKLEAAIAASQQAEEEARLRREQKKEATFRSQQKEKVRQFYLKQQKRREVLKQRDQERLANLRSVIEEQARQDKERVQLRANMLQRQREERAVRELERQKEEEEKQNRLEALRNQVGVMAEADPKRLMADTEAWRSRHLDINEFELQRPLYSINTYTDTQIVSDPRVRVEQALREAGLHHSQYAKEVLSVIKPPKPPRRDTKSILKF